MSSGNDCDTTPSSRTTCGCVDGEGREEGRERGGWRRDEKISTLTHAVIVMEHALHAADARFDVVAM